MADRASIASRIARLLSSGNLAAELLTRLDAPKDSDVARALENLLNLLGILRSLEVLIQVRHGQTPISPHVLQMLDDSVLRCDDIIRDLQAEKGRTTKGETGTTERVERERSAWQSLGSRMADESSHLLIALQQILTIEGHGTENVSHQAAELIEDSLQLFSIGGRGSDLSKTLANPQLPAATPVSPSVFLMRPMQLTGRPNEVTSSSQAVSESGSAIGELVQLFLEDNPANICRLEAIFRNPSESLPGLSDSPARWLRLVFIRFLSNLDVESRMMDDVQSLVPFLRSNIEIIAREFETRLAREEADPRINVPGGTNERPEVVSYTESIRYDMDNHSRNNQSIDLGLDRYFWPTICLHRNFIRDSNAFQRLRRDLDEFHQRNLRQPMSTSGGGVLREALTSFYLALSSPFGHFQFGQSHSYRQLLGILSSMGLLEPHVPPGYVRFRWKNRYAKNLYDDYLEHEPEALQALREYFDAYSLPVKTANQGGQDQISSNSASLNTPTSNSPLPHVSSTGNASVHSLSTSRGATGGISHDIEMGNTPSRTLLLLLCIERSGHPDKLHQELITDVLDDRQLFHVLRRVYREQMGTLKPFWSLKTLGSIQFMKFIYEGHPHIDVRCHSDLCEKTNCICVPPANLVVPKGTEYDCRPIPPGLSPPVGPKHMMDLFNDPEGYRPGSTRVIQQIPKKINVGLEDSSFEQIEAWGICFKEDWDRSRIWWFLAIVFVFASLLFGILWGVLEKDIQGAFGVASWWMTGATIFIGVIGTH